MSKKVLGGVLLAVVLLAVFGLIVMRAMAEGCNFGEAVILLIISLLVTAVIVGLTGAAVWLLS